MKKLIFVIIAAIFTITAHAEQPDYTPVIVAANAKNMAMTGVSKESLAINKATGEKIQADQAASASNKQK